MKTILIDNEEKSIKHFYKNTEKIDYLRITSITNPSDALSYIRDNEVELAVVNMDMEGINSVSLCKMLREIKPDISLIFVTEYEKYAIDSIKLKTAGYLLKPVSREDTEYAIESARLLSRRSSKKIFVKTFGHFDIFVNGSPVMFKSAKAKELLAFLVDRRGGVVTTEQIISALWENRPNDEATQSLCSKTAKTLRKELESIKISDILIFKRGNRRIDPEKIECDLFNFITGMEKTSFHGEYMSDYSWAESTLAALNKPY